MEIAAVPRELPVVDRPASGNMSLEDCQPIKLFIKAESAGARRPEKGPIDPGGGKPHGMSAKGVPGTELAGGMGLRTPGEQVETPLQTEWMTSASWGRSGVVAAQLRMAPPL